MHRGYDEAMSHVIQIRDVPDDVHEALREAAEARGLSLTRFMLGEMERIARTSRAVRDNEAVIRRTRARVGRRVDRDTILAAVREGRAE